MSYPRWHYEARVDTRIWTCRICDRWAVTGWVRNNGVTFVCATCAGSLHRSVGERIKDRLVRRMERRAS